MNMRDICFVWLRFVPLDKRIHGNGNGMWPDMIRDSFECKKIRKNRQRAKIGLTFDVNARAQSDLKFVWFFLFRSLSLEWMLLSAHSPLIRLYNKQISNLHSAQSYQNWQASFSFFTSSIVQLKKPWAAMAKIRLISIEIESMLFRVE